jgi:hypothetical protein
MSSVVISNLFSEIGTRVHMGKGLVTLLPSIIVCPRDMDEPSKLQLACRCAHEL